MYAILKKTGMGAALVSVTFTSIANAQVAPSTRPAPAYSNPSTSTAAPQGLPRSVVLGDYMDIDPATGYTRSRPRAVRQDTMSRDSQVVSWEDFKKFYRPRTRIVVENGVEKHVPLLGADGNPVDPDAETLYRIIASANEELCGEGDRIISQLLMIDEAYASVDQEYAEMQAIYAALPDSVKRSTRVMQISQAGAAGALCLLSAGLYCIAAVVGAVGNIFAANGNKRLQLAHLRLAIANVRHSRINVSHSRLNIQMSAWWVKMMTPWCITVYPNLFGGDSSGAQRRPNW